MYERFADRARRILVIAQEQSTLLDHDRIGSEHILLAMLVEGESLAGQALDELGLTIKAALDSVREYSYHGSRQKGTSPPFTPRAKKIIELSLREALQLGHSYIGPEHLLLGLVRANTDFSDGSVASIILIDNGIVPAVVRTTVIRLMSETTDQRARRLSSPSGQAVIYADREQAVLFREWLATQIELGASDIPEGHSARRILSAIETALKPSTPS